MLMGFDKFGMPEKPVLTLAYPQGNELGQIGNYMDFNFDPVFRSYSSISFKFPYSKEKEDLYNKACNQMRIKTEELGEFIIASCEEENTGTERYKQITANSSEVQMCRRKVNLLNGTYIFWGNSQSENDESLLGKLICDYLPTWTIGEISADLKNKWRTFDVPDATLYDFLMNEVSEAYECIFVFDTIGRKINAYTTEEAVHDSDIYVGYGNFLKSEKIEEISEEITTVMSCYGGEGVNIASVNPLGSVFLYNFDHFKPMMSESLSHHLGIWEKAIKDNEGTYKEYVKQLKAKNKELINKKADLRDLESMLAALEDVQAVRVAHGNSSDETDTTDVVFNEDNQILNAEKLKYVVLVAAIHKVKGEEAPENSASSEVYEKVNIKIEHPDNSPEILDANNSISALEKEIEALEKDISDIELLKKGTNNLLRLEPAEITGLRNENGEGFTADDLLELDYFKFESTHQDENYIITDTMDFDRQQDMIQDFYDSCVSLMKNISAPTYNITADTINFLFVEKIAPYVLKTYDPNKPDTLKQLLGVKFHLEIAPDEWIDPVLLKFHVNFDNPSDFSMEFSNKYRLNSAVWTYADLIGDAISSSGSMSFDYSSVKNWATHKDEMLDFINGNLDVSKNRLVNSSENNDFLIDNTGIRGSSTAKSGGDTNKGIWITADTIAFTTDNWESARTAIGLIGDSDTGGYGVNAELLIGKAILGNSLQIQNEANTMRVNASGLSLSSDYHEIVLTPNVVKDVSGKVTDAGGIAISKFIKDNGEIVGKEKVFYTDTDGNVVLTGKITATSGEIAGFTISSEVSGNKTIYSLKSDGDKIVLKSDGTATLGDLTITNGKANFNGTIYADQIVVSKTDDTKLLNNNDRLNPSIIDSKSIEGSKIADTTIEAGKIKNKEIGYNSTCVDSDSFDAEFNTIIANKGYITEARAKTLIASEISSVIASISTLEVSQLIATSSIKSQGDLTVQGKFYLHDPNTTGTGTTDVRAKTIDNLPSTAKILYIM